MAQIETIVEADNEAEEEEDSCAGSDVKNVKSQNSISASPAKTSDKSGDLFSKDNDGWGDEDLVLEAEDISSTHVTIP